MSGSKSVVSLEGRAFALEGTPEELVQRAQRSQRRAERELAARHEAERLLETKSLEVFAVNQTLKQLNAELEERVAARTRQVDARTKQVEEARKEAVRIGTTGHLTRIPNRLS